MSNSLKTKGVAAKNTPPASPLGRFKAAPTVVGAYTVKHPIPAAPSHSGKKVK